MIKTLAALAAVAWLAGCATAGDPPIETRIVTEVREVPVPCLDPGDLPVRPPGLPPRDQLPREVEALLAIALATLYRFTDPGQYADQADAALVRCATLSGG